MRSESEREATVPADGGGLSGCATSHESLTRP
jgi:hypothetical protein